MNGFLLAKCNPCDALVLEEIDPVDPSRITCKSCGAKLMPLTPPASFVRGTAHRTGISKTKGRLAKILVEFRPQHNRDGAIGKLERVIGWYNDRYKERVTICSTGEVTHQCDEALSAHQGHGSARQNLVDD